MTTTDSTGVPCPSRRPPRYFAVGLLSLLALGVAGCAAESDEGDALASASVDTEAPTPEGEDSSEASEASGTPTRTVTVYGEGTVNVRPDVADVQIGVQAREDTAQAALAKANESAEALLAELDDLGIPPEDVQTTDLSVYPAYGPEGGKIIGYEAYNTVNVTIREIDRAGEVIDAAAAAAGDNLTIGGISFSVDDPEAVMADARTEAVEVAMERARVLADAAGLELGDVLSITDGFQSAPVPFYAADTASAESAARVSIEPGSQTLTAQVTVVHELVGS